MTVYLFFFAIMLVIAGIDIWNIKFNVASRTYWYYIVVVLLICIAGCRWFDFELRNQDGTWNIFDYSAYEYTYHEPLSLGWNFFSDYLSTVNYTRGMDPGYVYVSSFFSRYITDNANLFFLFISVLTVCFFVNGLKRNHILYGIFIILFIYFCRLYFQYNFIMMRQAVALAIAWWGIPFVINRKFPAFLIICLLAGFFHFTGFLFIIVYWLPKFNFSNKFLLYTIPLLTILSLSGLTYRFMLFMMEHVLTAIGFTDKIAAYIGSDMYSRGINPLNFIELAPFFFLGIKYRSEMSQTPEGKFFFNLLILYTFFMLLTMDFMALTRISSYYIYSFFYIFSFAYRRIKIYENRVLIGSVFCCYFLIYGIRFVYANFSSLGYHLFFLNS